jgi:hypothetical protein
MEELQISQERETSLKCQIVVLHMEHDDALKEAQGLRRKQGEASGRHRLPDDQFSEFSFTEIEEATLWFDESLKIGEGGYENIYKGLLHQTKVAIIKDAKIS